jgi:hypothetical protein
MFFAEASFLNQLREAHFIRYGAGPHVNYSSENAGWYFNASWEAFLRDSSFDAMIQYLIYKPLK